jgi:hypothetical protein
MRDDQHKFLLLLGQLPARLNVEQAAWVLNCQAHDVPALVAAKLLKPLGNPPQNGSKFFATVEVLEASQDRTWLGRMSATIYQYWHKKNASKRKVYDTFPADAATPKLQTNSFPPGGKLRGSDQASASG